MRGFLAILSVLVLASCTPAGGGGGNGGGGGAGIGVGLACTPGYTDVCSYVNGAAAVLHCDAQAYTWAVKQVCNAGESCGQDSGQMTCLAPTTSTADAGGTDTGGTWGWPDTGTTTQPDTNTGGSTGTKYQWVIIDGSKNPDCTTNSPGPDIDAIALYRKIGTNWYLMGMAKSGTQIVKAPAYPQCLDLNSHDTPQSVCGPVNGTVSATAKDTGYFALGDRSVYVQIGECTNLTQDLKKCDGNGAVVDIELGDQLAIWEVDQSYKASCKNDGYDAPQCGYAYSSCTCTSEQYGVGVATTSDASVYLDLGTKTGTDMFIDVKKQ